MIAAVFAAVWKAGQVLLFRRAEKEYLEKVKSMANIESLTSVEEFANLSLERREELVSHLDKITAELKSPDQARVREGLRQGSAKGRQAYAAKILAEIPSKSKGTPEQF